MKLIRREAESDALADWLDAKAPAPWVSSTLIEVELPRALRRIDDTLVAQVPATVARIARYEIDDVVRGAAAAYSDPGLRSLDAIHLATPTVVFGRELEAFVSYDQRLSNAASELGLRPESPGQTS